jgi:glycerol-3-phosphate acyltransferase PlsY
MSSPVLLALIGYFIGSFASAYLVTRWRTGLDLREHGSKNIGTLNSYEVTGKRSIGGTVLIADLIKGALPMIVFASMHVGDAIFILPPAIVLGHCYPIWLRFHGGRGLATAAGVGLVGAPMLVLLWIAVYFLTKTIKPSIHFRAFVASVCCILAAAVLPANVLRIGSMILLENASTDILRKSIALKMLVVLTRHVQPLIELYRAGSRANAA